jgi:hypothetical protein
MSEPQTMYRAFFNFSGLSMWHPDSPAAAFHSSMELSPCGQYVQSRHLSMDKQRHETTREDISDYWQKTREQALAVVAPRLRQIGERLIRQADDLEQAAQPETRERPALAEVAATSGDMGRQAEGGE